MFRIGEFSKIARVATSQLRYYDQIGLFQPEHIDQFTGYRYYRASQLPELNRILALKELGLALEQIQRLVVDNVSADEIRGMLTLKKAQVEQELHEQIARLHQIEVRIEQFEQDGDLVPDDIVVKELPVQPFFSYRSVLPHIRQSQMFLREMKKSLPRIVSKKQLSYFAAIYHGEAFALEEVDVEMGFFLHDGVDSKLTLSSGAEVGMRILPRIETAACFVHLGGMTKAAESYGNLGRWIDANGYRMAGSVREVFIVPPNPQKPQETVLEIQIPVEIANPRTLAFSQS